MTRDKGRFYLVRYEQAPIIEEMWFQNDLLGTLVLVYSTEDPKKGEKIKAFLQGGKLLVISEIDDKFTGLINLLSSLDRVVVKKYFQPKPEYQRAILFITEIVNEKAGLKTSNKRAEVRNEEKELANFFLKIDEVFTNSESKYAKIFTEFMDHLEKIIKDSELI